ncbi:MAG: hypothetical protein ABFD18_11235 [Syntrophomonas sp.]
MKTLNRKLFQLKSGVYPNQQLVEELQQYGSDALVIEVLEVLEKPEPPFFEEKDALEKLQPSVTGAIIERKKPGYVQVVSIRFEVG